MPEEIRDLLAFYALGALAPEEQKRLEAALQREPELRQELELLSAAADALAYAPAPAAPGPAVRARLMQRVRGQAVQAGRRRAGRERIPATRLQDWLRAPALGAAGLLLAAVGLVLVGLTRAELAQVRAQNIALSQELLRQQQLLADPRLEPLAVAGTLAQPNARGRLFADPQGQTAVLIVSGLAPPEPGQTYQVWLIQGELPTGVGLLAVGQTGEGAAVLQAPQIIASYGALGVSLEPLGGSLAPTGPIVLLQELSY
jgi:anti-sigma-K factor RskA